MKVSQLFNSTEALAKILKLEMPIKKAYELRKFIKSVEEVITPFSQTRQALIEKYGEKKDNMIIVPNDKMEDFSKEMSEIDEEVTIEILELSIDELDGKIDTTTLFQLDYLIK